MDARVDRNALRFNQACIVLFTVLAFVLGAGAGKWVVLGVSAVMLAGTAYAPASLFKGLYRHVFLRLGVLKPNVVPEDPAPHQFAQGLGGTFLLASFIALLVGAAVVGWALAWMVVALALINLLFGFCAGCFLYFQLERLGLIPRSAEVR